MRLQGDLLLKDRTHVAPSHTGTAATPKFISQVSYLHLIIFFLRNRVENLCCLRKRGNIGHVPLTVHGRDLINR